LRSGHRLLGRCSVASESAAFTDAGAETETARPDHVHRL